jgi:hypothetical protein
VAEQELHRAQVAGAAIDQRRLRPTQRVRTKQRRVETRKPDTVADEPGVLSRGQVAAWRGRAGQGQADNG